MPGTVYDAARKRIKWLFEEFDGQVSVSTSGGKDSTVVAELTIDVARELGCLPVKLVWLDQECEYESTVKYQRWMADRPETDFQWYQIPFRLFNATNHEDPWLHVWGEGEDWVRPKEPDSIQVNDFYDAKGNQIDRFKDVLAAINKRTGGAILTGMRCEESPSRRAFMTSQPSYKWVTWGSEGWGVYWMFHPIYDWSYKDVWKAIYSNDWRYNTHYDLQFQYGVPINQMRVSNYHHETALGSLFYLQEAEPQTWEAATRRLQGISTVGHIGRKEWQPTELPYMFADWHEYLHYLIDNLVTVPEYQETFRRMADTLERYLPWVSRDRTSQAMVRAVIGNDLYGTTVNMFKANNSGTPEEMAWIEKQRQAEREQEEAFDGYIESDGITRTQDDVPRGWRGLPPPRGTRARQQRLGSDRSTPRWGPEAGTEPDPGAGDTAPAVAEDSEEDQAGAFG